MPSSTPSAEQSFRANLSQFRWARGVTDDSQQTQANQPSGNPFSRFYTSIAGDYIPLRSSEQSNEDEAWFALSRWERWAQLLGSKCEHNYLKPCRLLGFIGCLIGAVVCFFVAFITLPLLAIRWVSIPLVKLRTNHAFQARKVCYCIQVTFLIRRDIQPLTWHTLRHQPGEFTRDVWVRQDQILSHLFQTHLCSRFSVLIGPINHIKHLVSKDRLPFSIVYLASLGLTLYFALGVRSVSLSLRCFSPTLSN